MGQKYNCLVTVPLLIWSGFTGIGAETALVANCASIVHDPEEIMRPDSTHPTIPYSWTNEAG
ncbi:hypothetical protein [Paenibacillus sp. SYP-B3998]|uniref:hypothetical protein n=1 Tax=Paenibacillus sp. SYP-B3998 TaxID=2678564 RepID=UPI001967D254|nr:hypothetical protein [Paenibacillus sp. SYP-B3998]